MADPQINALEKLLGTARDGALLRYSLGLALLRSGEPVRAIAALREALDRDAGFSAAWKTLGTALAEAGRDADALAAWREGIVAAGRKGDRQAEKEMKVFVRRLEKKHPSGNTPA